jgi:hypothetical protein
MEIQKTNLTVILAITLAALVMTALVSGLLTGYQRIPNSGNLKATVGIGVYSDPACTNPLTSIDWGEVQAGQSYSRTIYIKNNGNIKVQLSMTTGNWTPSTASSYLSVNWNCTNYILDVGKSVGANIALSVASTAVGGSFSFDITIVATESQ